MKTCTTNARGVVDHAAAVLEVTVLEDEVLKDAVGAPVEVGNERSGEQSPTVCCSYSPSELLSTATS